MISNFMHNRITFDQKCVSIICLLLKQKFQDPTELQHVLFSFWHNNWQSSRQWLLYLPRSQVRTMITWSRVLRVISHCTFNMRNKSDVSKSSRFVGYFLPWYNLAYPNEILHLGIIVYLNKYVYFRNWLC